MSPWSASLCVENNQGFLNSQVGEVVGAEGTSSDGASKKGGKTLYDGKVCSILYLNQNIFQIQHSLFNLISCLGTHKYSSSYIHTVQYSLQEYDCVFDVDIHEGKPPLKLPYNLTGQFDQHFHIKNVFLFNYHYHY